MLSHRPLFKQVTIVGLGLIGGSLGMAIRRKHLAQRVIGFSRREATIREAKAKGAIDDGDTEFCPDWLGASDLVIIATPPSAVEKVAREIARLTRHSFILTDVASTKAQIVRKLERLPKRIAYVGFHPMAGSEHSGVRFAQADLFDQAVCVLTPTSHSDRRAVRKLFAFWQAAGMKVLSYTPARHDTAVAQVSHVPHLAAFALALSADPKAFPLAAGGFADTTRIAMSDPALWVDICRTNRKEVIRGLDRVIKQLKRFRGWIAAQDQKRLQQALQRARRNRQILAKMTGRSRTR